jgi:hypothetical protein
VDLRFLSPLFLIGLSAAAVPIFLHLFRRQADPVVLFGAVRFLQRAPVEQARRRRLREWLLLALRTLALVLLALSFARPYFVDTQAARMGPVTVLGMDTSYSMSAASQIERARALARGALDRAPSDGPVALVAFDDHATVMVEPTMDRGVVRAAIGRTTPGPRGTRYAALVSAAADLTAGRGGRVVVISDLQQNGWSAAGATSLPTSVRVEALDAGAPAGNLAVIALQRGKDGLVATVRNTGDAQRATHVALTVDGQARGEQQVAIAGGATIDVSFRMPLPSQGTARVEIADAEGFAADNVRYAVLDALPRPRIVALTHGGSNAADSFFVERALAAAEGPSGMHVDSVAADQLTIDPAALDDAVGIVVFSVTGLDGRGTDAIGRAVSQGAGLLVVPGPSLDATRASGQLPDIVGDRADRVESPNEGLTFAPSDVRHPIFRAFGTDGGLLGAVRFRRLVHWSEGGTRRTLARYSNGAPALVEVDGARGHVLLLSSDLANAWNDFALHPAFVPFVHDLLRYLASGRPVVSEYRVDEFPGPGGDRPGIVAVTAAAPGRGGRRAAINVDAREADRARMTPAAFVAAVPRAAAEPHAAEREAPLRDRERDQSLWRYGLMLMLVGLVAESVVGRRA